MKTSRCPTACAARMLAVLTASVLLVQCAMPPQQAWQYIQTNGLLPYLSYATQSPPLRTGSSGSQSYAAYPRRSSYYGRTTDYVPNNYFSALPTRSGRSRHVPRSRSGSSAPEHRPDVKIPVEEPTHTHTPQVAHNPPPPASSTLKSNDSAAKNADSLPYGTAVPGRMNMVNSPYAGKTQLVDVSGMSAGQTVKCPYTGKLFKVPPTQQAANRAEPPLESKIEAPKLTEEPKTGDKQP